MMCPHLVGTHASNDQQHRKARTIDISWFLVHSLIGCSMFLSKYINTFNKPSQTPWYVCLIEGWPHTEILGQPQS